MSRLRALLVEDHTLVRSGIRSLLEASAGIEVVGEAGDGRTAIDQAAALQPDLVLMDVGLGDVSGIDATRQILAARPDARVLILSMHSDEQYLFEALKAGAKGYVLKSAAVGELIEGIREVIAGRNYVSPSLSGVVMNDYARRAKGQHAPNKAEQLTGREQQILRLIAEGKNTATIARELFISPRTVETHRRNIMEKLGVHSIAGLTRFAIRNGLCSLQ